MQDATVQSIPQMSQVPAAVAPSNYVVAAPQAAPVSYQAAPQAYQVGTSYPQAVPQANPSYQSSPTQYAPQSQPAAPQGNPWESAFNKVVGLLSAPVQSPFQGQPSQAAPQYTPANYGIPYSQATQQSAPQTWQANQAYLPNSSPTSSTASSAATEGVAARWNIVGGLAIAATPRVRKGADFNVISTKRRRAAGALPLCPRCPRRRACRHRQRQGGIRSQRWLSQGSDLYRLCRNSDPLRPRGSHAPMRRPLDAR